MPRKKVDDPRIADLLKRAIMLTPEQIWFMLQLEDRSLETVQAPAFQTVRNHLSAMKYKGRLGKETRDFGCIGMQTLFYLSDNGMAFYRIDAGDRVLLQSAINYYLSEELPGLQQIMTINDMLVDFRIAAVNTQVLSPFSWQWKPEIPKRLQLSRFSDHRDELWPDAMGVITHNFITSANEKYSEDVEFLLLVDTCSLGSDLIRNRMSIIIELYQRGHFRKLFYQMPIVIYVTPTESRKNMVADELFVKLISNVDNPVNWDGQSVSMDTFIDDFVIKWRFASTSDLDIGRFRHGYDFDIADCWARLLMPGAEKDFNPYAD